MIRDPPTPLTHSLTHSLALRFDGLVCSSSVGFYFSIESERTLVVSVSSPRGRINSLKMHRGARGEKANVDCNKNEDESFRKCRSGAADPLQLTKADSQFRAGQKTLPSTPLPSLPSLPRPSPCQHFSKPLSTISQTRCPDVSKKAKELNENMAKKYIFL